MKHNLLFLQELLQGWLYGLEIVLYGPIIPKM